SLIFEPTEPKDAAAGLVPAVGERELGPADVHRARRAGAGWVAERHIAEAAAADVDGVNGARRHGDQIPGVCTAAAANEVAAAAAAAPQLDLNARDSSGSGPCERRNRRIGGIRELFDAVDPSRPRRPLRPGRAIGSQRAGRSLRANLAL